MIKTRLPARLGAALLLLVMLFSLLPIAVSAEEEPAGTAAYAEPMLLRADDYTEAATGFQLFADNPDSLPLKLGYAIYKATDTQTPLTIPEGWVTVTAIEQTVTDGEDAALTARPVFAVDFHKPGDINVEDPEYIESPEFLRAVSVSGSPVYTLAPGYIAAFRITGGEAAEDGTYTLDHTLTWQSEMPVVTFTLDRPAKLITRLTQNEGEHGALAIDVLNSDSVRSLYSPLVQDRDAFLSEYGLTDVQLYIQYDQTRMDVPSSYDAEADDGITEVWSPETLQVLFKDFDLDTGFSDSHTHSFAEEAFRAFFPEETFTEKIIDDGDDATEDPAFWVIDTEAVSLAIRARYVLALTAADGTVYYTKSAFTDPFYCGASNSLVTDPTAIEAPVLSDPRFETAEDGTTTLTFHVTPNPTVRDTLFWCQAYDRGTVKYALEISINGSEWMPYDGELLSYPTITDKGDISIAIAGEDLNDYAYIRVQMRYIAEDIPLNSPFSAALAFDKKPEEIVTAPITENTLPLYTETTGGDDELKYICPICGFCPAPYGVCLFLWIGAALLIVLLIVLIIALIPKKKYCPRCSAACKPQDKSCTTCGYRFVGNMPEIEDTTGEITLPKEPVSAEEEDAFFDGALRDGAEKAPRVTPIDVFSSDEKPEEQKTEAAPNPTIVVTPSAEPSPKETSAPVAAAAPAAKPDAAFLAELKRKMTAVKAGQKESFTPEEIAYIKALKDKTAAKAPTVKPAAPKSPAQTPAPAAKPQVKADSEPNSDTREHPIAAVRETPVQEDSREAQIARLRALRAKQLSAEDSAAISAPAPAEKQAEQLRRVEKPTKQIKCPACAVPNPETNGQCYICGTRLK
ncbi:MAG: hypothetical protein E7604_09655 [Ruminococcaceae bacterium]|nr:hypothetical protein [Oscillospiraceae bacterium]